MDDVELATDDDTALVQLAGPHAAAMAGVADAAIDEATDGLDGERQRRDVDEQREQRGDALLAYRRRVRLRPRPDPQRRAGEFPP